MNNYDSYLKLLYKLALKSYKNKDVPVGAIVIYDNKIIGIGYNDRQHNYDVSGHAEINAIKKAEKKLKDWRLNNCILISTLEPCEMCKSIIREARIKEVFYYLDQFDNKKSRIYQKIVTNDDYFKKYKNLFDDFFKKIR